MATSRVVIVRSGTAWGPDGGPDPAVVTRMVARGFALLESGADGPTAARALFQPDDRVGIKVNTIGGRAISTRPEVALSLAGWLARHGHPAENLFVWDRTNRELREAGYALSAARNGVRVFGTDADGVGYAPDIVAHLGVGSLFSRIQTDLVTASISLAILKDHGLAGVTGGLKNYFGSIHNPNKYHEDGCDPFVAEVFDAPPVRSKHRLTILDALTVQFHRGPSFHARWADRYGGLVFSRDPVAADAVGWSIIERLRAAAGLPDLEREGRAPSYLRTAERMGLGRADRASIETVEESVT